MFSIKILIITSFFSIIILLITSSFYVYKFPKKKYFRYFNIFSLFFLFGQILASSRNSISDFFSIIIGNTSLVIGYIFLYIGIRSLFDLDAKWNNRYFLPIGVVFLGFILFTYVHYDVAMRIVIFSIFCVIYSCVITLIFWKYRRSDFEIFDKISAFLFFMGVILFTIRTIKASIIELPANYLSTTDLWFLLVYVYLFFMTIWFSILLIVQGNRISYNKKEEKKN